MTPTDAVIRIGPKYVYMIEGEGIEEHALRLSTTSSTPKLTNA
jgi:hypothetical protein